MGVFDTVGAYGIPAGIGLSAIPQMFTYWTRGFHSRRISDRIRVGLHAMAIDEMRRPFYPTFWMEQVPDKDKANTPSIANEPDRSKLVREQMRFPGVHSNVGGGYEYCGLSDLALAWMISRVKDNTGLQFDDSELENEIWPCSASVLYRTSRGGPFARVRSIYPRPSETMLANVLRKIGGLFSKKARIARRRVNEEVHWSVAERCSWPRALVQGLKLRKYAPRNLRAVKVKGSTPTVLEQRLLRRDRAKWKDNCPLLKMGEKCLCETRAGRRPNRPAIKVGRSLRGSATCTDAAFHSSPGAHYSGER